MNSFFALGFSLFFHINTFADLSPELNLEETKSGKVTQVTECKAKQGEDLIEFIFVESKTVNNDVIILDGAEFKMHTPFKAKSLEIVINGEQILMGYDNVNWFTMSESGRNRQVNGFADKKEKSRIAIFWHVFSDDSELLGIVLTVNGIHQNINKLYMNMDDCTQMEF